MMTGQGVGPTLTWSGEAGEVGMEKRLLPLGKVWMTRKVEVRGIQAAVGHECNTNIAKVVVGDLALQSR